MVRYCQKCQILHASCDVVSLVLQLLSQVGISCTYIYSSLDQTARKINLAKFVNKKSMVMLVTDVAVSVYNDIIMMSLFVVCLLLARHEVLTSQCWIMS